MFKVGELVKWRCPQEPIDSDGYILSTNKKYAVIECTDYYAGMVVEVHLRYVRKIEEGSKGFGSCKKYFK